MNDVFLSFLSLSLSGSLLILILFLCKPFIKTRLSRQWQYYVWLIVIARLLLPVTSAGNIIDTAFNTAREMTINYEIKRAQTGDPEVGADIANTGENELAAESAPCCSITTERDTTGEPDVVSTTSSPRRGDDPGLADTDRSIP